MHVAIYKVMQMFLLSFQKIVFCSSGLNCTLLNFDQKKSTFFQINPVLILCTYCLVEGENVTVRSSFYLLGRGEEDRGNEDRRA